MEKTPITKKNTAQKRIEIVLFLAKMKRKTKVDKLFSQVYSRNISISLCYELSTHTHTHTVEFYR